MPSTVDSGTQAIQDSDGEVTIDTITTAGVYVLVLDLADLANGETVIARMKDAAVQSGTVRTIYEARFSHVQTDPIKASPPWPKSTTDSMVVTLQTSSSSGDISIPWSTRSL